MDNLEITGDNPSAQDFSLGDAPEITSDNLSDALEITGDNLASSPGDAPEITSDNPDKLGISTGDAPEITGDNQKLTRADIAQREGVSKKTVETWAKRGRLEPKGYISQGQQGGKHLYRYDLERDTRS